MIIIYGRRSYGRVESTENEHARTKFVHLYFMPLIPTESMWMTGPNYGIPIPLHGRSIAATYLRWWAPIIAIVAMATMPLLVGFPVGAALFALYAWSWSWWSVRGEVEKRRRDFNRLAFGTRMEPAHMPIDLRIRTGELLRERWDRLDSRRSPNEVGQFGAKDTGEAVIAYGILRLAALEHPGGDELAMAERILQGSHDTLVSENGPYRDAELLAPADVHAHVASAAATANNAQAAQVHANQRAAAARVAATRIALRPGKRRRALGVGALVIGLCGAGALGASSAALGTPTKVSLQDLGISPVADRYVTVDCDRWVTLGGLRLGRHAYGCVQGNLELAVLVPDTESPLGHTIAGKLGNLHMSPRGTYEDPEQPALLSKTLDPAAYDGAHAEALLGIAALALALGLGGVFTMLTVGARRDAKRLAALPTT